MSNGNKALVVLVDGAPMPEADARAFWQRFSDWMEEHRGDLAGFAAEEGFASVHPGVDAGRPVLRVSKTAPQEKYGPARDLGAQAAGGGGSRTRHGQRRGRPAPHDSPRKKGN